MTQAALNFVSDTRHSTAGFASMPQQSLRSADDGKSLTRNVVRPVVPVDKSFEERIFDCLVDLKVAVANISMHLSANERHRLFDELDAKVNAEDWHEDDYLPQLRSFQNFLKWMIYSKSSAWTSLGVSGDGTITVAWKRQGVLLTAAFDVAETVRWTARVSAINGDLGISTGRCSLRLFAMQAQFYLGEVNG